MSKEKKQKNWNKEGEKQVEKKEENENKKIDTTLGEDEIETSEQIRNLSGFVRYLFLAIAVIGALYHLYILNFNPIDPWVFRSTHLAFGTVLALMLYKGWKTKSNKVSIIDWLLIAVAIFVALYIYINLSQLVFRFGVAPTTMDFIVAALGLLLVLEITRRASGWILPILAFVFILYSFAGPYLPGILNHNGYSLERFATYVYGLDGVFGVTTDVSSKYIILFIIFGAFLQMSGVGQYFIDVAFRIAGGLRGGPAKVAVVSSGLMGMINGTSAGNVVATGSLTIPLMRKTGYRPMFAAATEATASSGGQLLPPIMGAGAFLMAEITGMPYSSIIIAATIPAILYFVSVYFMVDFQAVKSGMVGLSRDRLPNLKKLMKKFYLFTPVVLLIYLLVNGFSVIFAGTVGIVACFILSLFSKENRMGLMKILEALELGMKNAIQLIAIVATAGIIVGVIALTGVGQRFSSMLLTIADNNLLIALIFAMAISIILGMGMPTTAAYAVAASVIAPGLVNLGIEPIIAHMFVFYYAVISAITPPVALAAFAAAGISGTDPMKTSVEAFKIGLAAFIVPFMFFFSPELLLESGTTGSIILAVITALIGVYLLSAAVQGWFFGKTASWYSRIILLGAAIMFMLSGIQTDVIGIILTIALIGIQKFINKSDPRQAVTHEDISASS
ncbi:ATP-binding protein [Oceanobacillus oncorhynchi subsp. incaldanensis]|uniref:DctM-like transporters n=2 Tax=Oceanobacillus TaxID=182709 RepID=A0A0A1M7V0_9BACI|nr:TRAP transporter permease [Oceanobacillus oncorhynchi]MDM8098628.1 TRAP transporter permease [Oceanobacillus oncorhynchi]GIO17803.1 ATP-binding protein [Oceanobacillus oncorhynchi subsp. incaldanensis]CEI81375.1 DctM-like transporters [Oceanobacillus oncorhynchi]